MTATSTHARDIDASAPPAVDPVGRPRANRRLGARIGWTWILLTSLAIAAFAVVPYLTAPLAESSGGLAASYDGRPLPVLAAFYVHVVGGGLALVLGPLQFWRGLRTRHPIVHRWIGRTYLVAVGAAAFAGLALAPVNQAGLVGLFGFGALGVLWLLTGWRGYRAIRARDVASHRAWMMRNFALTYAAVMLRIWLPLLIVSQIPLAGPGGFDAGAAFANAYAVVPFLCWLPNLVVAEWLIRRRGLPSYRLAAPVAG